MISPDLALTARPERRRPAPGPQASRSAPVSIAIGLAVCGVVAVASPEFVLLALVVVPGAVAAGHDIRTRRIPDRSVAAVVVVASFVVAASASQSGAGAVAAAGVCALATLVTHLALHLVVPCALGFGDVKLAAALALAVGPAGSSVSAWVLLALMITSLAAAAAVVGAVVTRRADVPHAPALVVAVASTLLAAPHFAGVLTT